jgi:hypothetical protein
MRFVFVGAARANVWTHRRPIRDLHVVRLALEYTIGVELVGEHDWQDDNDPDQRKFDGGRVTRAFSLISLEPPVGFEPTTC